MSGWDGRDFRPYRAAGPPGGRTTIWRGAETGPIDVAMARIAFLGLGVMGAPMAGHLAAAGHELVVYNRSPQKSEAWVERHGGRAAGSAAEAAAGAEAVISCVGADEDVEAVSIGAEGAFVAMDGGTLFVDHTTVSARLARRLAEEGGRRGLHVVDAPVSGGQAGAEQGKLSIMCGGSDSALAAARPLMEAYAARLVHVGPAGHGQLTKMVNQFCIAGIVQGLSEAIHFAAAAGLDREKVFEAVSGGQAGAEQGKLSIMCGGSEAALAAARPLMQSYAARIVHVGPPGHGQLTKMVNQICIAGVVQGLSEAIHFAKSAGLDGDKVFEAVSGGAAQSWQMVNRWPTMSRGEFDFGFAVDWMRKDLGLTLGEARANGARLPLTALVDQFYADLQAIGAGRQDTSSLIRRLER